MVTHHKNPDLNDINKIDLPSKTVENLVLRGYLDKKEYLEMHKT